MSGNPGILEVTTNKEPDSDEIIEYLLRQHGKVENAEKGLCLAEN